MTSSTSAKPSEPEKTASDSSTAMAEKATAEKARFWSVFFSTFLTIFLAELGDKTQVATLLISAESHKPIVVFVGAASALISTSLVGVLVGRWLATRVSPETLDTLAGILLLVIAVGLTAEIIGV